MLGRKKPVEQIVLTQENPCFLIEGIDACTLHIHVHRKDNRPIQGYCPVKLPKDFVDGCTPCDDAPSNSCGEDMTALPIEYQPYDEWHTVSGTYKKVCLTDRLFRAKDGLWVIDVYEEVRQVSDSKIPDSTNLYREVPACPDTIGKKLCKSYEFYIGQECKAEIKPCTQDTNTENIMD